MSFRIQKMYGSTHLAFGERTQMVCEAVLGQNFGENAESFVNVEFSVVKGKSRLTLGLTQNGAGIYGESSDESGDAVVRLRYSMGL